MVGQVKIDGERERLGKFHRLCVWVHSQLPWQRDREGQETPLFLIHSFTLLVLVLELRIEPSACACEARQASIVRLDYIPVPSHPHSPILETGSHSQLRQAWNFLCRPGLNSKVSCLSMPSTWATNRHHDTSYTLEWWYKVPYSY